MKFELKPYNYGLSDRELLGDIQRVAKELGKDYVTKAEYDKYGRLCSSTFQKRFGGFGKAHELAGLRRIRNHQATAQDCMADLRRVAQTLGSDCISTEDYKANGRYSLRVISSRVGSWRQAIADTGLRLSSQFHETISDEDLFENLEQLWEKLGRQPSKNDFVKPHSRYSYAPYPRRFGSYRKALEAFVEAVNSEGGTAHHPDDASPQPLHNEANQRFVHRTNRTPSWRLRFLVMRHDNFRCVLCGAVQNPDGGITLELDHTVPWSDGGETTMANLQTLCNWCNGGKSNLTLSENKKG